jgi:hypothetical protein
MVFKVFQEVFTTLLTKTLLFDWSMFSSVDPSLAAEKMPKCKYVTGGFQYDFT